MEDVSNLHVVCVWVHNHLVRPVEDGLEVNLPELPGELPAVLQLPLDLFVVVLGWQESLDEFGSQWPGLLVEHAGAIFQRGRPFFQVQLVQEDFVQADVVDEDRKASAVHPKDVELCLKVPVDVVLTVAPRVLGGVTDRTDFCPMVFGVGGGAVADIVVPVAGTTLIPFCIRDPHHRAVFFGSLARLTLLIPFLGEQRRR